MSAAPTPQGANSSLESGAVLGEVLQQAAGDVATVPQMFSAARLPDAHALNHLDRAAYAFFRRRGLVDLDFLKLLSHVLLGTVLSKVRSCVQRCQRAPMQVGV